MKLDSLDLIPLFDYYGSLLTEKQRTCFDLYYNQDLSLSEIADEVGVSRQGVHDSIARAEAALRSLEAKLGCVSRAARIAQCAAQVEAVAQRLAESGDETISRLSGPLFAAADALKE